MLCQGGCGIHGGEGRKRSRWKRYVLSDIQQSKIVRTEGGAARCTTQCTQAQGNPHMHTKKAKHNWNWWQVSIGECLVGGGRKRD